MKRFETDGGWAQKMSMMMQQAALNGAKPAAVK